MRTLWGLILALQLLAAVPAHADNPFLRGDRKKVIASITYFGNRVTRQYVLDRATGLKVGDEWTRSTVADALERLSELKVIDWADIQEKTSGQEVHLVVTVEEAPLLSTRSEGLWIVPSLPVHPTLDYERRHDGLILGVHTQFINVRGRDETLDLHATWLSKHSYRARWSNPHILRSAHLGVFLDGDWNRYDFRFEPFRLTDFGGRVGAFREFGPWVTTEAHYHHRQLKIDDSHLAGVGGIFHDPAVQADITFDSRDLTGYPRRGVLAQANARFGGVGRDHSYEIYTGSLAAFYRVPYLEILAGRVAWRTSGQALPIYERSYLGGPGDVRGIGFGDIEGDRSYLATLELRYPLVLFPFAEGKSYGLGLHAFHDWGKAWEADAAFDDAPLRWSWGAGAHIGLGVYNLRFEWARTDDGDNAFVFEDRMTF